eukprot:1162121-Pelagomonas_calceolata.AAC.1
MTESRVLWTHAEANCSNKVLCFKCALVACKLKLQQHSHMCSRRMPTQNAVEKSHASRVLWMHASLNRRNSHLCSGHMPTQKCSERITRALRVLWMHAHSNWYQRQSICPVKDNLQKMGCDLTAKGALQD